MRTRLRSTIKWGGTVLTVLLLVVWVGSAWWTAGFHLKPTVDLWVFDGRVNFGWAEPWSIHPVYGYWRAAQHSFSFCWWFDGYRGTDSAGLTQTALWIPIWALAAFIATPTLWLWHRDRRRRPGLCIKCGYDLRGADHAVCPECGGEALRAR